MATDSVVSQVGLFTTPEQYQQQLAQQALANSATMAQLTPEQSARQMAQFGGYQLAGGLASAMGAQDPQLQALSTIKQLSSKYDTNTSGGVAALATELQNRGLTQQAFQLGQRALEMRKLEAEAQAKTMEKLTNEQRNAAGIADASGAMRGTPEWSNAYKTELNRLTTVKDASGSEFERMLKSLNLTPEQEKSFKQQRLNSLLNNDPNGIKAITAQLGALQLQERQFKFDEEQKKSAAEKQAAITKLAGLENDIDESLTTAAKAIKLAPDSFLGATGQEVGGAIPWTDQRALKNLVSSLNSDKAIGTLQELKTQSKTGATGFGALNTKELQLVLDKTRALDPADKMFKENLTTVMNGWQRIRQNAVASRENLQQGKPSAAPPSSPPKNPEAWVTKNMEANKGYSRAQVIAEGIKAGKLPADYK